MAGQPTKLQSARTVMLLSLLFIGNGGSLQADEMTHEGTFLGSGVGRILILNRDQISTRSIPVSGLVKVERNGSSAILKDLVRGDLVQVTTQVRLGTEVVISILAIPRS